MAKFRIALGVCLLLLSPAMIYIGLDSQENGINLAEPNGTRGAAMFDLLGMWGMALVLLGVGVSEIVTGKKLLKNKED